MIRKHYNNIFADYMKIRFTNILPALHTLNAYAFCYQKFAGLRKAWLYLWINH